MWYTNRGDEHDREKCAKGYVAALSGVSESTAETEKLRSGKDHVQRACSVVNIEPTTIRRDFSFLGNLGKQGYGYDVNKLIVIFNQQLGMDFDEKIILVGEYGPRFDEV